MLIIVLSIILISLTFAPLGCIALWKRYIYFGDALAHASLLAGSLSLSSGLPMIYCGIIFAIIFAILVFNFKTFDNNAVISLVASTMVAVALVISYSQPYKINIDELLFGDIITVVFSDLAILAILFITVTIFILLFHKQITLMILNKDIAIISGVKVAALELAYLILLSVSVFATIKTVGTLLVTSVLLIPAMSARTLAKTPVSMIILSAIIALFSNLLGLFLSFYLDIPVAAMIIIVGTSTYCLITIWKRYGKTTLN